MTDVLDRFPEALIAAVGDDGLLVPMPPEVLGGRDHRVLVGRSVIDMVVASDKVAVITAWERSRVEGESQTVVHLLTDPTHPVVLVFIDATGPLGVHLAAIVPVEGGDRLRGHNPAFPAAPKITRLRKNERAMVLAVDDAATAILGWSYESLMGRRTLDLVHPDDQDRAIANWMEMLTAPGHEQRVRLRHQRADGSWLWMEVTNRNLLEDPDVGCITCEMVDISDELAAQEALRASEQLLRQLAEALPLGVVQVERDRSISYVNERLADITGIEAAMTIDEQFELVHPLDRSAVAAAIDGVLTDGRDHDVDAQIAARKETGRLHVADVRSCHLNMRALVGADGEVTGAIICVSDVTERARMTAELERRATFDSLTGCHNRRSIMAELHERLADPGPGMAIIFVDLDGFKGVNDTLGHLIGDTVLVETARRLISAVRPHDLVGRVGGDEFLIVCCDVATVGEARAVADRIEAALLVGVPVPGAPIVVRASLGVAHTNEPALSSERLVAEADTAMYAAKRGRPDGGARPESDELSLRRARLSGEADSLRAAIADRQLEVHFQPVVELPSRSITGLEALVRWRRDGGLVPASAFIAMAETTGLVVEMGAYVLDEVCRCAAEAGIAVGRLSWYLNMSVNELASPHAARRFATALDRHGLSAAPFVIEVTEHGDVSDAPAAIAAVHELRSLGAGIALDDFGTGYSSLATLRTLPVTCIKLDRTFTAGVGVDPAATHILGSTADLARRLDLTLVVEGVETEAQAAALCTLGVRRAQGFLFAPARPLVEIDVVALRR